MLAECQYMYNIVTVERPVAARIECGHLGVQPNCRAGLGPWQRGPFRTSPRALRDLAYTPLQGAGAGPTGHFPQSEHYLSV